LQHNVDCCRLTNRQFLCSGERRESDRSYTDFVFAWRDRQPITTVTLGDSRAVHAVDSNGRCGDGHAGGGILYGSYENGLGLRVRNVSGAQEKNERYGGAAKALCGEA
jgi:hypothetical protein